jgi:hypothetical protein
LGFQIQRSNFQIGRNSFKAGRNENQIQNNEIKIQVPPADLAFSTAYAESARNLAPNLLSRPQLECFNRRSVLDITDFRFS